MAGALQGLGLSHVSAGLQGNKVKDAQPVAKGKPNKKQLTFPWLCGDNIGKLIHTSSTACKFLGKHKLSFPCFGASMPIQWKKYQCGTRCYCDYSWCGPHWKALSCVSCKKVVLMSITPAIDCNSCVTKQKVRIVKITTKLFTKDTTSSLFEHAKISY